MKMQALDSSETLVPIYQTTCHHIQEDHSLHIHQYQIS
jgi:hypothetical protein